MKVYFALSHYREDKRSHLADILRPMINTRSLAEKIGIYGPQITQYEAVSNPMDADLHVLTMNWSYYFETGQLDKARSFIEQARRMGKSLSIWQSWDFSIQPVTEDAWLFQSGGQKSSRVPRQFAKPVFVGDPLQEVDLPKIKLRLKNSQPVIGFCGQAEYTISHALATWLRFGMHNLKSKFRLIPYEPLPLHPLPTYLRWQALHYLEKAPEIQTNFIKRRKYRAGARTPEERNISRREFLENMLASDYIVCIRGGGNFSARLYETLAMGRIPIFIDTDCILPYDQSINWKEYCVWVDESELASLPQKVLEFHSRFDDAEFLEHQMRCRSLWEERLSFPGFFKHFPEHFS